MYVIEVIPLKRGSAIEKLSYFSSSIYPTGTIISIPFRSSTIQGMVVSGQEVSATKAALRAATFSLRKLPNQPDTVALSPEFIRTAEELALLYATHVNVVLYALLAPDIRSGDISLPHTPHIKVAERHIPEVFTASMIERYDVYRALVRETFAHSGSLLLVAPTSAEAAEAFARLSSGIEDRVVLLSSTITRSELKKQYVRLSDFTKPQLIIATLSHSIIERHDITTMILEHERSPHYRERTRPYLDYRDVLTTYAHHTGRRIILADLIPRSEEENARREEQYGTLGEPKKRIVLPGKLELVHMNDKPGVTSPFILFSPAVRAAIETTIKERGRTFLFTARRGLAPVVSCIDCGYIFRSEESSAPFSLIRTRKNDIEERWFVCPVSGHREPAADTCPTCGSWRLRERGIGIQFVHDELGKLFPHLPVILFDHMSASTYKKACFLRDKFYDTKGAVMLGTHMAIPYLTKPMTTSVVVNMDALLATPTWRQQEDTLAHLLQLREQTTGIVFIQTRTGDNDIIEHARQGSIEKFFDEELELRKTFNYPPYTYFIHLTWQGSEQVVKDIEQLVREILKTITVTYYSAPPSKKGTQIRYGLIRVSRIDWPSLSLVMLIRSLPNNVRVMLNPDRIV
jgi:primosomal protein N'